MASDIVIIGGGIAGLAIATELKLRKAGSVIVLEKDYIGSGNSTRSVGRTRTMQLTESLTKIAIKYQEKINKIGDDFGFNVLFRRGGYALLLYDDDEVALMRKVCAMHNRLGVKSELLGPEDTLRLMPVLREGEPVKGALFNSKDASIHHDPIVWAYHQKATELGCSIHQGCEVKKVFVKNAQITGVDTTQGSIDTRIIVNAAGPSSSDIARLAGITIPTAPLRREAMVTMPIKHVTDCVCTFYRPTEGWFNQTMRGEFIAGAVSAEEKFGYNRATSFDFPIRTSTILMRKAPILGDLKITRCWAGMYDITPDHLPLIGQSKDIKGFYQLNGWSARGLSMAPYASELLAHEIITGDKPDLLKPFNPDRFERKKRVVEIEEDYYARYVEDDEEVPLMSN